MARRTVLANNVVLISDCNPSAKAVAIGFCFAAGSRYETAGELGISHFCEHMLFKGTSSPALSRTTHDIACAFDRMGGYVNAFTERESVVLHCLVPATGANAVRALEVLCDMAQYASFPPAEVENERRVIQSEIISVRDDPEESALEASDAFVWNGSPLSFSISGSVRDVEALTREQLVEWYRTHFARGELVVCVAGNADEEAVRSALSALPPHEAARRLHGFAPPRWNPGFCAKRSRFSQMQLLELYPVRAALDERRYFAMAVANAVVGDTMSSRLFESLRERSGFCYTVYSCFSFYEDAAQWTVYASCAPRHAGDVVSLLDRQMEALRSGHVTGEELSGAKEHLCGDEVIGSADAEFLMKRLMRQEAFGFPFRTPEETVALIRSISAGEVDSLLRSIAGAVEDRAFLAYGPRLGGRAKRLIKEVPSDGNIDHSLHG